MGTLQGISKISHDYAGKWVTGTQFKTRAEAGAALLVDAGGARNISAGEAEGQADRTPKPEGASDEDSAGAVEGRAGKPKDAAPVAPAASEQARVGALPLPEAAGKGALDPALQKFIEFTAAFRTSRLRVEDSLSCVAVRTWRQHVSGIVPEFCFSFCFITLEPRVR